MDWVKRHVLNQQDEDIEKMNEEMMQEAQIQAQMQAANPPQQDQQGGTQDQAGQSDMDKQFNSKITK